MTTCKECSRKFGTGETTNGMCWVCAATVASEVRAMDEEEAFATLNINELVAAGYVSDEELAEMMAPWESEVAIAA